MIRFEVEYLKKIHKEKNPQISYSLFEFNYCCNIIQEVHVIDGDIVRVYNFKKAATSYNDNRKPNEIQTTD